MPQFVVIPTLVFAFWLGGLSIQVAALASTQNKHADQPAHTTTIQDVATIKTSVQYNARTIAEIKAEQDRQREASALNTQKILEAIRDQNRETKE